MSSGSCLALQPAEGPADFFLKNLPMVGMEEGSLKVGFTMLVTV